MPADVGARRRSRKHLYKWASGVAIPWPRRYGGSVALLRAVFLIAGMWLGVHGVHAFAADLDGCVLGCDDDAPDGTCPPDCADCACCVHQAPLVVGAFILTEPRLEHAPRFVASTDDEPSSADPRELQHVPKLLPG